MACPGVGVLLSGSVPADFSPRGSARGGDPCRWMSLAAPADLSLVGSAGGVLCARAWVVLGVLLARVWGVVVAAACLVARGFGLGVGAWSRCPELGLWHVPCLLGVGRWSASSSGGSGCVDWRVWGCWGSGRGSGLFGSVGASAAVVWGVGMVLRHNVFDVHRRWRRIVVLYNVIQ